MRTVEHAREEVRVSDGLGLLAELIARLRAHRWDRKVAPGQIDTGVESGT
jgi:hypothetical protein